jgi:hypothetical protein
VVVASTVFVIVRPASLPPPPPQFVVQTTGGINTMTVDDVFGLLFTVLVDSVIVPVFAIVVLATPLFTTVAMVNVAVELALISPIVQIPVELA